MLTSPDGTLSRTRSSFFTVDLSKESQRDSHFKAVDQEIGSDFACVAAKINQVGDHAYFLLDDIESHRTFIYSYDLLVNDMFDYERIDLPY